MERQSILASSTTTIKKGALILLGILWLTLPEGAAHGGQSLTEFARKFSPSIVRVTAFDNRGQPLSSGTGFFMGRKEIATARHLFTGASGVVIETIFGEMGKVLEVSAHDPRRDILLAKTDLHNPRPLILGDSQGTQPGEEILVIRNDSSSGCTISPGVVTAVRTIQDMKLFQMTAVIRPGWSGAPVINRSGEVIAMAVAFLGLGEDLNFAIPAHYLKEVPRTPLRLEALPETNFQLDAALRGENLLELMVREDESPPNLPSGDLRNQGEESYAAPMEQTGPRVVVFRDGRTLHCERLWREGNTVFILMPGKKFAVGYPASHILVVR